MFIAMNRFRVIPGQEKAFEDVWLGRDTHLADVPGFALRAAHGGAGEHRPLYAGHPQFEGFEVIQEVLPERAPA